MIHKINNIDLKVALGDIHGNLEIISNYVEEYDLTNTFIIQVGDIAVGYYYDKEFERLTKINQTLKERNSYCYCLMGNHNDPRVFRKQDTILNNFSNIKFLNDFDIIEIDGERWLILNGAISIDRKSNIEGIDWFPDEKYLYNEDILKSIKNIDKVFSHAKPKFAPPFTLSQNVVKYINGFKTTEKVRNSDGSIVDVEVFIQDDTLEQDLIEEGMLFEKTYNIIKENSPNLKEWYYGHYHFSDVFYYENVKFTLLNIDEFKEIR